MKLPKNEIHNQGLFFSFSFSSFFISTIWWIFPQKLAKLEKLVKFTVFFLKYKSFPIVFVEIEKIVGNQKIAKSQLTKSFFLFQFWIPRISWYSAK